MHLITFFFLWRVNCTVSFNIMHFRQCLHEDGDLSLKHVGDFICVDNL